MCIVQLRQRVACKKIGSGERHDEATDVVGPTPGQRPTSGATRIASGNHSRSPRHPGSAWALPLVMAGAVLLSACSPEPGEPDQGAARILGTKIIVRGEGPAKWHAFEFDVPEAGPATLRLNNAAQTGSPPEARIQGAEVRLNGKSLVDTARFTEQSDVLALQARVKAGRNTLKVRLDAETGKRLALRIDAPADSIELAPVLNPVVAGKGGVRVQARVTALGRPVRGAEVRFTVSGLGTVRAVRATTNGAGLAMAHLKGFKKDGRGHVKASVTAPLFTFSTPSHRTPLRVLAAPVVTVRYGRRKLTLRHGDEADLPLSVQVHQEMPHPYHVTLETRVEPDGEGLGFSTDIPGGLKGKGPETFDVKGTVTGFEPGDYRLITTARITGSDVEWSSTIDVEVTDPDEEDRLIISGPLTVPAAIPPSEEETPVVFRAYAMGTKWPPEVLYLHEVNPGNGKLKPKPVAELRDDGKNGDTLAGDMTYATTVNLPPSSKEKITYYRLRAEHFGETVLSGYINSFHVTEFPIGIRSSDPEKLVKDPESEFQMYSNEVAVGVHFDVDSSRVEEIASAAGGKVVGYYPPLGLYQVLIAGDGTAAGVAQAVKTISAFSEVTYAEPNHEIKPAAFPVDPSDDGALPIHSTMSGTDSCSGTSCQWYIASIGAQDAWEKIGGTVSGKNGGNGMTVAVLEVNGFPQHAHDLTGKVTPDPSPSGTITANDHATQVGGLIAAIANNGNTDGDPAPHEDNSIAGVAWNATLQHYHTPNSVKLAEKIIEAHSGGAKIINISEGGNISDGVLCALHWVIRTGISIADLPATCPGTISTKISSSGSTAGGALIIAGAGYDFPSGGCDEQWYPAVYNNESELSEGLIAVGAMDQSKASSFTWTEGGTSLCASRGNWVDIYAPGHEIYTTTVDGTGDPNPYMTRSGASFSTALVSGAAAVLWALNDQWTNVQIHERLIQSASEESTLGTAGGECAAGPAGSTHCRRLNLHKAVTPDRGVALVFDTSGSMGWNLAGTLFTAVPVQEQRLHFAKKAAKAFLHMLDVFSTGSPASPSSLDDFTPLSAFGIVRFLPPDPADLCPVEIKQDMVMATDQNTTDAANSIDMFPANSWTPLRQAILLANSNAMLDPPSSYQGGRSIIVLSDGDHICPNPGDAGFDLPALQANLTDKTQIHTILFGPTDMTTGSGYLNLQALAGTTVSGYAGKFVHVDPTEPTTPTHFASPSTDSIELQAPVSTPLNLHKAFQTILERLVDVTAVSDPSGTIIAGETVNAEAQITKYDHQVAFFLAWKTPQAGRLSLSIKSSDGEALPLQGPGIRIIEEDTYTIISVERSFLSQKGKVKNQPWTLEISADGLGDGENEDYFYSILVKSGLRLTAELDKASYKTGELITISARITEAGRPLTGLHNVKAIVGAPGQGLGNWLSTNNVRRDLLETGEGEGVDPLPPAARKAHLLKRQGKKLNSRKPGRVLPLRDDGHNGDATAGDGIYTNQFAATRTEGVYHFSIQARGPLPGGHAFQREGLVQKYVAVNAMPEFTDIEVKVRPPRRSGIYDVTLTPRDAFGNHLGPSHAGSLGLTATGGSFEGALEDLVNGRYHQTLKVPFRADEESVIITLRIGQNEKTVVLADLLRGARGSPNRNVVP